MVRKNCTVEVATPRPFQGTAFCTAMRLGKARKPRPKPMTRVAAIISSRNPVRPAWTRARPPRIATVPPKIARRR